MSAGLADAAALAANRGETKKLGVINTFRRESDLLRVLPFPTIRGNAYSYTVETTLAGAGSRALNAAYTESTGAASVLTEPIKIYGGTADYDRALLEMNGPEPRAWIEERKSAAIARQISFDLIEGSSATSSNMDGLKTRIPASGTGQSLALASTAAMSMRLLDSLRLLVDNPTHWLMSKEQALNIWDFLRSSGTAVRITADEFGRELMEYAGLPILIANRNGDAASLPYTEASSTASLFCLSIGPNAYTGIQSGSGLAVIDQGLLDSPPVLRTLIEWLIGQGLLAPRCAARGYSFTNAKAVA